MARFKRCPVCGASVKVENLDRHVARAHPGQRVDFALTEEEEAVKLRRRRRPSLRSTERLLYPVVAVVIVVAVVLGVVLFLSSPPGSPPGTQASDFVLPSDEGGSVHLADFRGGVVLLDFMDTDCGFCQSETANVLVPLHETYSDRVTFLSVDVGTIVPPADTMGDILTFKSVYGATWTYVLDDGTVAPKYGVSVTPWTFVLNSDLTIHSSFRGSTPYTSLSDALDAALGG